LLGEHCRHGALEYGPLVEDRDEHAYRRRGRRAA
jgi:hypothetical protein